MDALISVIIPAYNIERYIARTLDSLLEQSYENLEIIVVNDGSKDGTGAIIDDYARKDRRVKAVHKENGGVTSARLKGISMAAGQYIGFVDGDDYIEPQMYRRLMGNLKMHHADISHCGYQMVFPSGRVDYYYNTSKLLVQEGKQGCLDLLDGAFIEPGLVNKLFQRQLFDGLESWMDTSIRINEDLLMNYYLFRQAKRCVFEDICPYHYILRENSATTSKINEHQLKDPLKVQKLLYEETKAVPQWHQIAERRLMYQLACVSTLGLGDQKELIKPFRKEARKELRKRLWKTLRGSACGRKRKLLVLWAAVWPASYHGVHWIYARLTGVDKKYSIE